MEQEYFHRKGYYRHKRDGTIVYVKPTLVKNNRRKTRSLTKNKYKRYVMSARIRSQKKMFGKNYWKYSLGRFGYKNLINKNAKQRHNALNRAISKFGYDTVKDRVKKTLGALQRKERALQYKLERELKAKVKKGEMTDGELFIEQSKINTTITKRMKIKDVIKSDYEWLMKE